MQKKAMPAPGAELELTVTDLNIDGSAVAKDAGLVFFIDAGLPGEVLLGKVQSVKKNVVMVSRLKTLRPSPSQVEPFCRYFGDCGGCTWQNFDYQGQLLWKHSRVEAALRRIAKVEAELPPVLPSPAQRGFRNKMEYAFGPAPEAEGGMALGLRRRASREICPVEACPLQSPGSAQVLGAVRGWAQKHKLTAWNGQAGVLRHLVLRESPSAEEPWRMVELVCAEVLPVPLLQDLYNLLQPLRVQSFTVSQRRDKSPLASGGKLLRRFGAKTLPVSIGSLRLEFPAQGFVQTNSAAAKLLYDLAREFATLDGTQTLWDIYCGVGSLGLYLADGAKALLGVELSAEAVKTAGQNAAALGLNNCAFIAGDAARVLPKLEGRPDILLSDPPRGGMSDKIIPAIKAKAPEKIIYVSCDPATMARDIAALAPKYRLSAVRAVDMFPHTPHVECISLLELV